MLPGPVIYHMNPCHVVHSLFFVDFGVSCFFLVGSRFLWRVHPFVVVFSPPCLLVNPPVLVGSSIRSGWGNAIFCVEQNECGARIETPHS